MPLNGVLLIDKPEGISSGHLVRKLQSILRVAKVGHGGTLDPLATGVLVVCINEAAKVAPYLLSNDKAYEGTLLLGVQTDTDDITGKVIARETSHQVTEIQLRDQMRRMVGPQAQIPPLYSAIKKNGKPLYQYAREDKEVERLPRAISIFEFEIMKMQGCEVTFYVRCSKGTYVRALCRDLGRGVGTFGCLKALRRVQSGIFSIGDALSVERVSPDTFQQAPHWKSLSEICQSFPHYRLPQSLAARVRHGYQPRMWEVSPDSSPQGAVCFLDAEAVPVAMAEAQNNKQLFEIKRVFNI